MTRRLSLRRLLPLFICALLIGPLAPCSSARAAAAQPLADHVVLISVDGLRPEFYLDPTWPAPMIQQMREEGASARGVESVYPSVTYPSHTAIITGALPARHGIYYNSPFEPGGPTGRWYWHESSIHVPTLWDAARAAGLSTASIGWPVSVGAPIDRNLPEIWSLDPDADPIETLRAAESPPGLLAEVEREATGRLTAENFTIDHMTRDDRAGDIGAYLLATYRPALLAVHLIETDHFQHETGRDGRMVRRSVATADRAIAQIVEAADRIGILERTAFIVTGDHGHGDLHSRLAPNVWLSEAGLLTADPANGDGTRWPEWRAAFLITGAAAFLHLEDASDQEAVALARRALGSLPPRVQSLFRIVEREELDRRGAAPEAVFALAPADGVYFAEDALPPAIRPGSGATHGYPPERPVMHTGFVGWGAGFRQGAVAPLLRLTDIAPVIARLLGLDFDAPDGFLPEGLLESPGGGHSDTDAP